MARASGLRRALPCAACVLILTGTSAGAQSGTITGLVIDAGTRQPIADVTVEIAGTVLEARTRANGRYTILTVPPGVYTLTARRIGYTGREVSNVAVRSDYATTLNFELDSAPALTTVRVEAERPPVDLRAVGSEFAITGAELRALPVVDLAEMLMLSPGFAVLGEGASLQSLASQRRGDPTQISVRGGRPGSTVQLLDGIPINHPIFGSAAIDLNPLALASLSLSPGYMEAQYGGSVAGVVNMTLREGEERLTGHVDYQTTDAAGLLGSGADAAAGSQHVRGVISGPLGSDRIRLMVAGQMRRARDRAVQFPIGPSTPGGGNQGFTGWNGFGGVQDEQVIAKLSLAPLPSLGVSLTGISQSRRILAYDRRFLANYQAIALGEHAAGNPVAALVQGGAGQTSHFVSARVEQRFALATVSLTHALLGGERETCNVYAGICLADRFWRPTRRVNGLFDPFVSAESPVSGTAPHFGGESFVTRVSRFDVTMAAADHVRLQAGAQHMRHDLSFRETGSLTGTTGAVRTATNQYRTRPVETAAYAQGTFDYDFLLATVGLRYERGTPRGTGFHAPRLATNGTTAREVCNGTAPGINTTPFTYGNATGIGACTISPRNARGIPVLLDSAARLAATDDYRRAGTNAVFAPRIGVSFPVSDRSALFFNAGAYSKPPYYHDAFSNTGLGTIAGFGSGTDGLCDAGATRPQSNECRPNLAYHQDQVEYAGNPNVANERATTIEIGYSSLLGRNFGLSASLFSTEQGSLTSFVTSDPIEDIGLTYSPDRDILYSTIENGDLLTTRGVSIGLRRQLTGIVGYVLNYTWSQTTEVGLPPDLAAELGVRSIREERQSPRDRPHAINAALFVQFRDAGPPQLGRIGTALLSNTRIAVTAFWSKGPNEGQRLESTSVTGGTPVSIEAPVDRPANPVNLAVTKELGGAGGIRYAVFLRAMNIFNSQTCCSGFSTIEERRATAAGLPGSAPDQRLQYRAIFAGVIARH